MPAKLLGVLNVISQSVTVERTDVPTGPATFDLVDGAYFAMGEGVGYVSATGSGTTIPFASGHPFVAGQRIVAPFSGLLVWGPVTILSTTPTSVTVDVSVNYTSGEPVSVYQDLIDTIEAGIHNLFTAFLGLHLSLNNGVIEWIADAAETYTVTLTDDLATWMRVASPLAVTDAGVGPVPSRQMIGQVYLGKEILSDVLTIDPRASQSEGVTGRLETIKRASVRQRPIRMRSEGPPRSSIATTYQALEDLWESHFSAGLRWRYYVDASVVTPYAVISNPRGYETMVHLGPERWKWDPLQRGNDNHGDVTIRAQEYVA
jgi:hypothetical protein